MVTSKILVFDLSYGRICLGFLLVLTACGGGNDTEVARDVDTQSAVLMGSDIAERSRRKAGYPPSASKTAEFVSKGAELNRRELEAMQAASDAKLIQAGPKAFSGLITAYRFFNTQTGAHFYTVSVGERDHIIASLPQFTYEGPAFYASAVAAQGLSQVHRFYNMQTGVHFYTISVAEKNQIQQSLPQFQYEGVAYYGSTVPGTGLTPLNRFFVSNRGFHFYSNSQSETNSIRNNPALSHYLYEGVGYSVLGSNYEARPVVFPHTGTSASSCYQLSSNAMVDCESDEGRSLYQSQDGHRTSVNPISYSEVPAAAGGTYPRTECVRDNVTGVVWEGKNAVEPRSAGATMPYAAVAAYVNYVNSIALCGFTNWRLPTIHELLSIVHYGVSNPAINTEWFPNSTRERYWSSTPSVVSSSPQNWVMDFLDGDLDRVHRGSSVRVRLVRH